LDPARVLVHRLAFYAQCIPPSIFLTAHRAHLGAFRQFPQLLLVGLGIPIHSLHHHVLIVLHGLSQARRLSLALRVGCVPLQATTPAHGVVEDGAGRDRGLPVLHFF